MQHCFWASFIHLVPTLLDFFILVLSNLLHVQKKHDAVAEKKNEWGLLFLKKAKAFC